MGGLLAKIFGAGDVIEQGVRLIDSLHTSDEERIQAGSKAKTDLLTAYAPFKLAQRVLAFMFAGVFIFSFFLVLVLTLIGKGNTKDVMEVLNMFYIGEIMLSIIIFYFGGGFLEGGIGKFKEPKNGT